MQKEQDYIYAIYQERSFSRAARKLFISQPALSNKIKKIEEQLGVTIFDRSNNPIQLTPAGKCYIEALEKIMEIEDDLQTQLRQLATRRTDTLTIGSASYFCSWVLPELVEKFQRLYPMYAVSFLEGNNGDLTQCLQTGVVDFVLDVDAFDPDLFTRHIWGEEELILAVPAVLEVNNRLKDKRLTFEEACAKLSLGGDTPRVNLEEFKDEEFLMLKKGNDANHRAITMCRNAGFRPKITTYMEQMITSYYVSSCSKCISFIRADVLDHVKASDKLFFYQIDDENTIRPIFLYHKKSRMLSPICRDFLSFMKNYQK